jgi:hypothetical protein
VVAGDHRRGGGVTLRKAVAESEDWFPIGLGMLAEFNCGLPFHEIGRRHDISGERARQRANKAHQWLDRDRDVAAYLLAISRVGAA